MSDAVMGALIELRHHLKRHINKAEFYGMSEERASLLRIDERLVELEKEEVEKIDFSELPSSGDISI